MCELEDVIRSPIVFDEDSEGQLMVETIIVCLTKLCSQLLLSPNTDQRTATQFMSLLDICLNSSHFGTTQKQLFMSWKQKIKAIWSSHQITPNFYSGRLNTL